jgi:hypothetical protein
MALAHSALSTQGRTAAGLAAPRFDPSLLAALLGSSSKAGAGTGTAASSQKAAARAARATDAA